MADADAAIDALCEEWMRCSRTGDLDAIMRCYTDDCAISLSGDKKIIHGKNDARERTRVDIDKWEGITIHRDSRDINGDTATEMGAFDIKFKGVEEPGKGTYMIYFVKRNGQWLFHWDFTLF